MKKGYWIVRGDRTSCGGLVLEGHPCKTMGRNLSPVAVIGNAASCGKYPGKYSIVGGYLGENIKGRYVASTLYSHVNCPCNARLIPSQTWAWHQLCPKKNEITPLFKKPLIAEPVQHAQSVRKNAREITLTLGIFFDGTGNNAANTENMLKAYTAQHYDLSDPEAEGILARCARENMGVSGHGATSYTGYYTNVHWLNTLYKEDVFLDESLAQVSVYIEGIGTETGKPDNLIGQGLGIADTGVIAKTDRAVLRIAQTIQQGLAMFRKRWPDCLLTVKNLQFDIFGFSRGATASRHFANRIHAEDAAIISAIRQGMEGTEYNGAPAGKIRFIGIFDSVAAIGTPLNGLNPHSANTGEVNLVLRPGVAEKVFHITAQHECRFNFALNSVRPAWPELALPGVHSDIGGGYLPVMKENLFLSRPETNTVLLSHPDEKTFAYQNAIKQRELIAAYPAIAPLLRSHEITTETWYDDRLPQDRYGRFQKRSYAALTLRNRIVKNDWAKVALRVMLDAAQEAGAMFDEIEEVDEFDLPAELIPLCEKAIAMGKAARSGRPLHIFTQDEMNKIAKEYIHCSANWNAVLMDAEGVNRGGASLSEVTGFVNRPDEYWKRTTYNMDGKKV